MNPSIRIAWCTAYGVALGYLFTVAIGHILFLVSGADWLTLTIRIGAVAWVALILMAAWSGSRWSRLTAVTAARGALRGLFGAVSVIGFVSGIVVADSLLSIVSLSVGAYIHISDSELLTLICLAWLAFGTAGAFVATRMTRRRIDTQMGTDL